jgi:uncharacterized membrane protein YkoI
MMVVITDVRTRRGVAMKRSTKVMSGFAIGIAAAGAAGLAVANATSDEDEPDDDATETAIRGDALRRASDAALDHTGGGRVTGSEVGDEESYYEIEVTLDNGDQVDVQLDESFDVVGSENDGSGDDD